MQTTTTTMSLENLGLTIYNKIGIEPILLKVKFREEKGSFSVSRIDSIKAVRINHAIARSAVFCNNCSAIRGKWEKISEESIITIFVFYGTEELPDVSSVTSKVIVDQLRKLGEGCTVELLPKHLFKRGKIIIPIKILD